MTDDMNKNELQDLWQSEKGEIDMDMILDTRDKLERGRKLGGQITDSFFAFMAMLILLFGFLEFSGILTTGGWLTGGIFIFFCVELGVTSIERQANPEISSLSPQGILENAIERAQSNLIIARTMYAVFPISELIGIGAGLWLARGAMDMERASLVPYGAILVFLILAGVGTLAIVIFGLRLAKRKHKEFVELKARLKEFDENV